MNGDIIYTIGVVALVVGTILTYWGSSIKSTKFEKELNIKNEKIAKIAEENVSLSKENSYTLTGGDSYPILAPSFIDQNNEILFSLHNDGEYPLYDIDLYIYEDNDSLVPTKKHFTEIGAKKAELNIYKTILPKNISEKEINVITSSRNGETRQIYKCFRSNGTLGVKTAIYRNGVLIKSE
ncbi:MAG: hypothetical protein K8S18_08355 [Desulfobacula sp.]|nr:hypothetical protein [Desulfobacula sp.]